MCSCFVQRYPTKIIIRLIYIYIYIVLLSSSSLSHTNLHSSLNALHSFGELSGTLHLSLNALHSFGELSGTPSLVTPMPCIRFGKLSGEMDGKLCIAAHARIWLFDCILSMYLPYVHNQESKTCARFVNDKENDSNIKNIYNNNNNNNLKKGVWKDKICVCGLACHDHLSPDNNFPLLLLLHP